MTSLNGTVNGATKAVPPWDGWRPITLPTHQTQPAQQPQAAPEVSEYAADKIARMMTRADPAPAEPLIDHIALAEAEAIRTRAAAEAEAKRIEAEGQARAAEVLAVEEAKAKQLANERAALRLERERAVELAKIAEANAKKKAADTEAEKAAMHAAAEAEREADRTAEQQRSEFWWKWGARGIYAIGLAIAAPVQFLDFWDPAHPFMVVAPALLEGFALVLAFGAAWAVAHRRDVAPYRVGIMFGAMVAAAVNLRGGMTNPVVGLNAGIIGAVASLGGPIVLMAYEHGIAQKVDGIPSYRERRTAEKAAKEAAAARERVRAEREDAARKAAEEKAAREAAAEAEQKRKDDDRRNGHEDVWRVAESLRSARGSAVVTEQIWGEAWLLVTGSRHVGITPEIEALSRAAHARMKTAADSALSLVESQVSPREKRDPNAPDGRRFNGGTPPRRTPGDTAPFHPAAKALAADAKRQSNTARED